jgi:uncharacterized membrane protein
VTDLALTLHVLAAMVLVGTLALAAAALFASWRGGAIGLVRLGFRSLLWAALPAWIVLRVTAQWVLDESGYSDDLTWVDIGFIVSEPTLLLLIAATVLSGRELRRMDSEDETGGMTRAAAVLVGITIAAYLVVLWAMTTKPT